MRCRYYGYKLGDAPDPDCDCGKTRVTVRYAGPFHTDTSCHGGIAFGNEFGMVKPRRFEADMSNARSVETADEQLSVTR